MWPHMYECIKEGIRKEGIYNEGKYFDIIEYGLINKRKI